MRRFPKSAILTITTASPASLLRCIPRHYRRNLHDTPAPRAPGNPTISATHTTARKTAGDADRPKMLRPFVRARLLRRPNSDHICRHFRVYHFTRHAGLPTLPIYHLTISVESAISLFRLFYRPFRITWVSTSPPFPFIAALNMPNSIHISFLLHFRRCCFYVGFITRFLLTREIGFFFACN